MGRCYELGLGLSTDIALAIYWYKKAAQNGFSDAQFAMGQFYEMGKGMEKDPYISYYWYKKAAENGHKEAKKKISIFKQR